MGPGLGMRRLCVDLDKMYKKTSENNSPHGVSNVLLMGSGAELGVKNMKTYFASTERQDAQAVADISMRLRADPMAQWFDAMPLSVLVLNKDRQIVYCNEAFQKLAKRISPEDIYGLRPGEALRCVNAHLMEAGCGCSDLCSVCGAARAIISSLRGDADCQECSMIRALEDGESVLDMQVFTKPVEIGGERFSLFTAMDISHEKRLGYLERKFFHDMVNAAGGMAQVAKLSEEDAGSRDEYLEIMGDCSRHILREVLFMRDVTAAEIGRLSADYRTVSLSDVVKDVLRAFSQRRDATCGLVDVTGVHGELVTDPRLLGHVLGCLYANALEAGDEPKSVVFETRPGRGFVEICITNPGVIPDKIRKQLFKRYVSTKDRNRGLGLYVSRMIARDYLRGDLSLACENGLVTSTLRLPTNLTTGWAEPRLK